MKKLKVGVVGIGGIGSGVHLPAYASMEDVEVVAVCDVKPEKMEQTAVPKSAKRFSDYRELIEKGGVDAVDICTPNYLHSEIAVAALNAGKHVFCEKPDAVSPAERSRMTEAEERSGKTLMVMRNNRFCVSSEFLKQYIDDGKMGRLYAGRCGWIRRRGIPGKGGWFTTKSMSGGGALIDLGVHVIDLAVYLMGSPKAVSVSGSTFCEFANAADISDSEHSKFGEKLADGIFDVEDLTMGFIKFDNGACLQVEVSWASNIDEECRFVELRGSKAGLSWRNEKATVYAEENGVLTDVDPKLPPVSDGHRANLRHFADVVLYGSKPLFESAQGENIIRILDALYESARTGREVLL